VFYDAIPYSLADSRRNFGKARINFLNGDNFSTLKTDAQGSSETSAYTCRTQTAVIIISNLQRISGGGLATVLQSSDIHYKHVARCDVLTAELVKILVS